MLLVGYKTKWIFGIFLSKFLRTKFIKISSCKLWRVDGNNHVSVGARFLLISEGIVLKYFCDKKKKEGKVKSTELKTLIPRGLIQAICLKSRTKLLFLFFMFVVSSRSNTPELATLFLTNKNFSSWYVHSHDILTLQSWKQFSWI